MAHLTIDEQMDSSGALSNFIAAFDLRDKNGVTIFPATISYTIAGKETFFYSKSMITMEGYNNYGELTVICDEINPSRFPEKFSANWQRIIFLENIGLKIEDVHPKIGTYKVLIYPK